MLCKRHLYLQKYRDGVLKPFYFKILKIHKKFTYVSLKKMIQYLYKKQWRKIIL